MRGPSEASLRAVGLQWYAEDDIPAKCSLPPRTVSNESSSLLYHSLWDKDCVAAILASQGTALIDTDVFTQQHWVSVVNWYAKVSGKKAPIVAQLAAKEASTRVGKTFAEYPSTASPHEYVIRDFPRLPGESDANYQNRALREGIPSRNFPRGPISEAFPEQAGDLESISDTLNSLLNFDMYVAVGVLVLGLGLLGIGVFRLIR